MSQNAANHVSTLTWCYFLLLVMLKRRRRFLLFCLPDQHHPAHRHPRITTHRQPTPHRLPTPINRNKAANYLFIEQPVGVGFSYSTTPSAYLNVGDDDAAALNYQLILQFLARFPQYQPSDFYISAESYG
jgi:hypothetical protein